MGRPREHSDATYDQLLRAARRLLAEEGPRALGLRGLAEQVDTSTRAVYSLFGSKENLVRALYVTGFAELVERLRAVPHTGDPRADLLASCAAYREHARADPMLYRLTCEQLVPEFEPTCADREQAFHALVELSGRIGACRDADLLAMPEAGSDASAEARMPPLPVDSQLDMLTRQWWAVLHGLTALELRGFLSSGAEADTIWAATLAALVGERVR